MTTQEFIQQLRKMPVTGYSDKKILFENGLEITYSVKLAEWNGDLPLQMLILVGHNGSHVMTWGAETEQDNAELVHMWRKLDREAQVKVSDRKGRDSQKGYNLLMKGLQ